MRITKLVNNIDYLKQVLDVNSERVTGIFSAVGCTMA
jgi:hypothetical protein